MIYIGSDEQKAFYRARYYKRCENTEYLATISLKAMERYYAKKQALFEAGEPVRGRGRPRKYVEVSPDITTIHPTSPTTAPKN